MRACKATCALALYLSGVWSLLLVLSISPAQALISSTGYARVVHQAEMIAAIAARKAAMAPAVATAAAAASPASIAVRLVAGPVGWAALGVTAGLTLAQVYYSQTELQDLKAAATPSGGLGTSAGFTFQAGALVPSNNCGVNCTTGQRQEVWVPAWQSSQNNQCPGGSIMTGPPNWTSASSWGGITPGTSGLWCYAVFTHVVQSPSDPDRLVNVPGTPPTAQQVEDYLTGLPASNPLAIESNAEGVGVGTAPQGAEQVSTQSVSGSEMPSEVVPVANVQSTDTVINSDAPVPQGTQTIHNTSQDSTTRTTTTTNPDGSVTEQTEEQASFSCSAGSHDSRTFATILQEHQARWSTAPLLGQLEILKNLVWPSALPVLSMTSTLFGTMTVDFGAWSTQFAILKTIILFGAALAAVRIVFVGGS